jgi:hypothetical protein
MIETTWILKFRGTLDFMVLDITEWSQLISSQELFLGGGGRICQSWFANFQTAPSNIKTEESNFQTGKTNFQNRQINVQPGQTIFSQTKQPTFIDRMSDCLAEQARFNLRQTRFQNEQTTIVERSPAGEKWYVVYCTAEVGTLIFIAITLRCDFVLSLFCCIEELSLLVVIGLSI